MLERRSCESCLISRVFSDSCQPETKWSYMYPLRGSDNLAGGKHPLPIDGDEDDCRQSKCCKLSGNSYPITRQKREQSDDDQYRNHAGHCSSLRSRREQEQEQEQSDDDKLHDHEIEQHDDDQSHSHAGDYSSVRPCREQEQSDDDEICDHELEQYDDGDQCHNHTGEYCSPKTRQEEEQSDGNRLQDHEPPLSEADQCHNHAGNYSSHETRQDEEQSDDGLHQNHAGQLSSGQTRPEQEQSDDDQHHNQDGGSLDSLIHPIGRDNTISCLIRCSRSDYGSIASLNRSFRSLVRSGEIYRLRRQNGVIEHWVYFSCHLLEWEAFDPIRRRWMHLPRMTYNECFMCSDKESLAVGTELLVFGKDLNTHVIYRYSLLTNSWSSGMRMNAPRCLFGSASLGEIAILAGGCDSQGNALSCAELYNSENQTWTTLPSMNKPRKMCSGFFMDGKFYVIGGTGGTGGTGLEVLTCGEEYDLEAKKWTEIPNMSPGHGAARENEMPVAEAPPLVAVVNNELYAADYADMEVKKYDKKKRSWFTVGRLPERAASMNGWGLAFRACGDRLIVIGGPRALGEGFIELNSWVPSEGPPQWDLLARKQSGNFVYNCAVMGC